MAGQRSTAESRLLIAVIGSLVLNVLSVPLFFLLPGSDDVPAGAVVAGVVLAVIAIIGAYGLWNHKRWGWLVTFVVTLLNVVSSAPGIAEWPSAAIGVTIIVLIVLGIALLVFLRRPEIRNQVA